MQQFANPKCLSSSCEMAVGIICSCLPVVFSTIRGVAKVGMWATLVRYVKSGGRYSGASGSGGPVPQKEPITGISEDSNGLPQIPQGTLTGVKSFIRKAYRSKPANTINVTTELHTFSGLASIDDDYHAQLQRGYFASSNTHLNDTSQASVASGPKGVGQRGC